MVAVAGARKKAPSRADDVVGLFFFAGHGLECDGENLLVRTTPTWEWNLRHESSLR
jgi:uncharacterized caspase-like protein